MGVCGCLLVSEGAYWCVWMSERVYLYLMVTAGVCDCLWVHEDVFWCLRVPTGV